MSVVLNDWSDVCWIKYFWLVPNDLFVELNDLVDSQWYIFVWVVFNVFVCYHCLLCLLLVRIVWALIDGAGYDGFNDCVGYQPCVCLIWCWFNSIWFDLTLLNLTLSLIWFRSNLIQLFRILLILDQVFVHFQANLPQVSLAAALYSRAKKQKTRKANKQLRKT